MDISTTTNPDSTQVNADDLIGGPQTFTIKSVSAGTNEQPVNVYLQETDRAYRPSKSMRRVMVAAWGAKSDAYIGQRLTLYREPSIRFGKDEVGGIRISHMSGIDKPLRLALTVKRGQRDPFIVQPLPSAAPSRDWSAEVASATTDDELRALWEQSPKTNAVKDMIAARHAELGQGAES